MSRGETVVALANEALDVVEALPGHYWVLSGACLTWNLTAPQRQPPSRTSVIVKLLVEFFDDGRRHP